MSNMPYRGEVSTYQGERWREVRGCNWKDDRRMEQEGRRMSDTISRQAAIDALDKGLWGVEWELATAMLKDLPSAQPEIIRCKDCKYRYIDEVHGPSCELDTGDPYATGRNADEDNWFCADAERRTDG